MTSAYRTQETAVAKTKTEFKNVWIRNQIDQNDTFWETQTSWPKYKVDNK